MRRVLSAPLVRATHLCGDAMEGDHRAGVDLHPCAGFSSRCPPRLLRVEHGAAESLAGLGMWQAWGSTAPTPVVGG